MDTPGSNPVPQGDDHIDPAEYAQSLPETFWTRPYYWQQIILRDLRNHRRTVAAELAQQQANALPPLPDPPFATELEAAASAFGQPWHPGVELPPLLPGVSDEFFAVAMQAGGVRRRHGMVYGQPVRMMTLSEAAADLGVSVSGTRRLISRGVLPKVSFGRTVRLRSDLVWAVRNRPDLPMSIVPDDGTGSSAYRPTPLLREPDMGVALADVADLLRVSVPTLRRWSRKRPDLLPITGRGPDAVVDVSTLSTYSLPYKESQVRLINYAKLGMTNRKTRAAKRAYAEALRSGAMWVTINQVRRSDHIYDGNAKQDLWTMRRVANMLSLSISGARKALTAAGIRPRIIAGAARVRADDVEHLARVRNEKYLNPDTLFGDPPPALHLDLPVAAQRLGITVRTLRRWIAAKRIEAITRDEQLWVRAGDVAQLRKARRAAAAEQKAKARSADIAARRGAVLTEAHMANYTDWLRESKKDPYPEMMFYSRNVAAMLAGCRPSVLESLVREGHIPAMRTGRGLRIRHADLYAAPVFSAKVARMCPDLPVSPYPDGRRYDTRDYLTLDLVAHVLNRPLSNIKLLCRTGVLHSVHFGHVHRIHASEVLGSAYYRLTHEAGHYPALNRKRYAGQLTVCEAANRLAVSERTVQRWYRAGALAGGPATRTKLKLMPGGEWNQVRVPINHGGLLLLERHVEGARRARQVNGKVGRDLVPVTPNQVRSGRLPQLMPWEQFTVAG